MIRGAATERECQFAECGQGRGGLMFERGVGWWEHRKRKNPNGGKFVEKTRDR